MLLDAKPKRERELDDSTEGIGRWSFTGSSFNTEEAAKPSPGTDEFKSYSAAAMYCSDNGKEVGMEGSVGDGLDSSSTTIVPPHWTQESFQYSSARQPGMAYFTAVEEELERLAESQQPRSEPASVKHKEGAHNRSEQEHKTGSRFMFVRKSDKGGKVEDLMGVYPKLMRNIQASRKSKARHALQKQASQKAGGRILKHTGR